MDILEVLISQYESGMSEHIFEMNACLTNPTSEGCVDRLDKAVKNYALIKQRLDILQDLKGQMVANQKFDQQNSKVKDED